MRRRLCAVLTSRAHDRAQDLSDHPFGGTLAGAGEGDLHERESELRPEDGVGECDAALPAGLDSRWPVTGRASSKSASTNFLGRTGAMAISKWA
jgi:hypothetical protein